jgi:Ca2+-binding EF-hand superfamily protein
LTTFTALTLVGSNSISYANQLKPFDGIQFSKIDLNNDNLISKTELMNHRKREFSFADTNHDGALSTEELIAARTTNVSFRAKRMMQILDQNSNGVLEFDELNSVVSNRFGNIFESLDLNNDGHLSKKEFSKLKNRKG